MKTYLLLPLIALGLIALVPNQADAGVHVTFGFGVPYYGPYYRGYDPGYTYYYHPYWHHRRHYYHNRYWHRW